MINLNLTLLPFTPARIEDTGGKRDTHNDSRIYFNEQHRSQFMVMEKVARAFQSEDVVHAIQEIIGAPLAGTSLRIEYCQDTGGFWLEPHTDIGVKKFTLQIYLNREPEAANWGTDIYVNADTYFGEARAGFNTGMIFVPGNNTWHGFKRRPIDGVRKSIIVNYVGPEWRNRHELCFPLNPV